MQYKDYYATLGVSRDSSSEEIQKAYRKLARKYHPDVNPSPEAESRFKEITESYEVLKDKEKRQTYDRFGSQWKNYNRAGGAGAQGAPGGFEGFDFDGFNFSGGGPGSGPGGASGFSSFFEMLFNQGQGGRARGGPAGNPFAGAGGGWNQRGHDQEARIALTLEEAARGGKREITVNDPMSGQTKTFSVSLPAGVKEGQKIRLSGRGGPGAGGAGDLLLVVDLKPHPKFRVEGKDLHTDLPVAPWEAALGCEATVKTLDDGVKVRIPAGTSSGRKIRLRGRGFPSAKDGNGDLFAEIKVVVPKTLSDEERRLFEELSEVSKFKAR